MTEGYGGSGFRWLALLLCAGAFYALTPLWAPVLLAAWVAVLAAPLMQRLSRARTTRSRAAVLITTALVAAVIVPVIALGISLSGMALQLWRSVLESKDQTAALRAVISGGGEQFSLDQLNPSQIVQLVRQYGQGALSALETLAGATTNAALGLVVFVLATYTFIADGDRIYKWLADHAVIPKPHFHRLANAFSETGRGLLVGTGLTAALQGTLAALGYVVLGVPRALLLGFMTALAGLVPSVGTALVWVPLAAGLFAMKRWGSAVGVLIVGTVISLADNFVRPLLSRVGDLRLPGFLLFLAMIGGVAQFGGWGLLLGPLFVRLAVEALAILRDQQAE